MSYQLAHNILLQKRNKTVMKLIAKQNESLDTNEFSLVGSLQEAFVLLEVLKNIPYLNSKKISWYIRLYACT